jgi:hypothetical protein
MTTPHRKKAEKRRTVDHLKQMNSSSLVLGIALVTVILVRDGPGGVLDREGVR